MISFYDKDLWFTVFHLFTISLLIHSIMHRIWEYSKTTLIVIIGFEIFGVLIQFSSIGSVFIFLMVFMMYLYYKAMTKPRNQWSKNECN